jgi:hypothetical protein
LLRPRRARAQACARARARSKKIQPPLTSSPVRVDTRLDIQKNTTVITAKLNDDDIPENTTSRSRGWLLGELVASHVWNWHTSAINIIGGRE